MSQLPSKRRIDRWKGIARRIDSHFCYGYFALGGGPGPCHYVIDRLEPKTMFADLVSIVFIEDYLEAMNLVCEGTPSCIFLKRDPEDPGPGFKLWWPEVDRGDNDSIKFRGYLTDDLRSTLIDTVFKTRLYRLDSKALETKYHKLIEARDCVSESEPKWGAMYVIIRLFEATLAHVALSDTNTRSMIKGSVGEQGGKKLREREESAIKQAIASNERWRRSLGLLELDETPPQPVVRLATVIPLFGR